MALTPGIRLGPYQVASQIGAGGMGEVYRATDANLGRDVAIKVLPKSVAPEPERLARFDREALTLAALSQGRTSPRVSTQRLEKVIDSTMRRFLSARRISVRRRVGIPAVGAGCLSSEA